MEVSHDNKPDYGNDNADEFDALIRGGAGSPSVGDFLIENGDGGTDS